MLSIVGRWARREVVRGARSPRMTMEKKGKETARQDSTGGKWRAWGEGTALAADGDAGRCGLKEKCRKSFLRACDHQKRSDSKRRRLAQEVAPAPSPPER